MSQLKAEIRVIKMHPVKEKMKEISLKNQVEGQVMLMIQRQMNL